MEAIQSDPKCQTSISIIKPSPAESERCVTYYKPNIWSYDYLENLVSDHKVVVHGARLEKLKEDTISVLAQVTDAPTKLQIIDNICKLGLETLFSKEIMEAFDVIASDLKTNPHSIHNLGAAALCFRLLRQHGYKVSQDVFADFLDEGGVCQDTKEVIELYEASYVATEDEHSLIRANALLQEHLKALYHSSDDKSLAGQVVNALGLPQHWRAQWFGARQQIDVYGAEVEKSSMLFDLAKVNFATVQASHQTDLRDLSMWWKSLGLVEKISFARDRLVESFVFAVGIAPEPNYACLRKCLAKVISFILVLDDIYDVYGSLDELELFTEVLDRWDWEETCQLPECMKICFSALSDTTDEIAKEIQKETGFHGALPYIRKAWADFCKSMLTEARWYNRRYTPSLEEYLNTGWVSSSGSLLSMVILLHGGKELTAQKLVDDLEEMNDLIYYTSLIIRLCNDVATTAAEIERGDSASSILCYMREAGVTEEAARIKINDIISETWKKINAEILNRFSMQSEAVALILNTARVAHCFYHTGDGFGVQDGDIKKHIKQMLIEPLQLN